MSVGNAAIRFMTSCKAASNDSTCWCWMMAVSLRYISWRSHPASGASSWYNPSTFLPRQAVCKPKSSGNERSTAWVCLKKWGIQMYYLNLLSQWPFLYLWEFLWEFYLGSDSGTFQSVRISLDIFLSTSLWMEWPQNHWMLTNFQWQIPETLQPCSAEISPIFYCHNSTRREQSKRIPCVVVTVTSFIG